jgi:serine/threonine protein kinase
VAVLHEHIEGKYEILGKIREGGMGAVYKVRHRLLDEIRVVKVLRPHLGVSQELNDRFLREARLAIQLRHANIAQLHDFSIAEDGTAFIVMEFIDGATLEDVLAQSGPPPLGLGLEIGRQALKALGFLHRRGLIHRDISPDNLMLTRGPDGEPLVKLIDLGIAKVLAAGGGLTSTGIFLGKPRYASPEQLSAAEAIDARSDLYSFGVVLYELLTGMCPIQGKDVSSIMAGHLFRPPLSFAESDPRGRVPEDLRALVLRALAKDPAERFAGTEELAREIAPIQVRFPFNAEDLDAALRAAAGTLAGPLPPPPGSTQDRLDRHFIQAPTPVPAGEATMVLSPAPPDRTVPLAAAPVEVPPPDPLPKREEEKPVSRAVAREREIPPPPPPPPLPPPAAVRREAPPAPRSIQRKKSLLPVAALVAFLVATVLGLGLWWRSRAETPAPAPAAEEVLSAIPPAVTEPPGNVAVEIPPASLPAASPSTAPLAEPEPTPPPPAREEETTPQPREAAPPPRVPEEKERDKVRERAPERRPREKPKPPEPAVPDVTLKKGDLEMEDLEDVEPARLLSVPPPVYPEVAKGTGSYARILVAVLVDESGAVTEVKVKSAYVEAGSSQGSPSQQQTAPLSSAFRDAAMEAARQARFDPAMRNGKPVRMWGELNFEFGKKP